MTLPVAAAQLLWMYTRLPAAKRADSMRVWVSMHRYESLPVFQDVLLEQGLITMSKNGTVTVTPRGKAIGARIPNTYSPIDKDFEWWKATAYQSPRRRLEPLQLDGLYMRGRWMRHPGAR